MHFKVQKNTFPSTCNELPGEPRREGGRRKETNMAGRQFSGGHGGNGYSGVGGLVGGVTGGQHGGTSSVSNFCGGTSGGGGLSASQQLIRLQHQVRIAQQAVKFINYCIHAKVNKLSGELDRLSGLPLTHPAPPQTSHQAGPASSTATSGTPQQSQQRRVQGCCTSQLHTLSLSLNQVYAALWGLQRELSRVSERVGALEEARQGSSRQGRPVSRESMMSSVTRREEWPAAAADQHADVIWPGVGGADQSFSAGSGFREHLSSPSRQNPGAEWGNSGGGGGVVPPWPPHPSTLPPDHHLSPFPSRDLWNSLQVGAA